MSARSSSTRRPPLAGGACQPATAPTETDFYAVMGAPRPYSSQERGTPPMSPATPSESDCYHVSCLSQSHNSFVRSSTSSTVYSNGYRSERSSWRNPSLGSTSSLSESGYSDASVILNPWPFCLQQQQRRPPREASIVFAEELDTSWGQQAATEDLHALIQKERRLLQEEVVSMPHDSCDMFDGDISENEFMLQQQSSNAADMPRRPIWMTWFVTALIAFLVSAQCALMAKAEAFLAGLRQDVGQELYNRGLAALAVTLLLAYGLLAATVSAVLVVYVSPRAASSGIPDTKAFLNGNRIPGFLSFNTWFARTFALLWVTQAGLFAGSEGPLLAHIGAIISSGVARGRIAIFGWRFKLPWKYRSHTVQAQFVSLGTAIGIAGAFGSPVGGLLFSFEEQSTHWSVELTWRTFLGCTVAAMFTKAAKNGFQSFPITAFVEFPGLRPECQTWEMPIIAIIGLITGILGALFCEASFVIGRLRQKVFTKAKPRRKLRFFELYLLTTAVLLSCYLTPMLLGCRVLDPEWKPSGDDQLGGVGVQVRGFCREGEYSDLATLVAQPKHAAIKALFTKDFEGNAYLSVSSLIIAYSVIFVFTTLANGMAMPYGLFVPHILAGACLGRAVGSLFQDALGAQDMHLGVYAVVGAAGQLAGISRMTISLTMILMEITGNMRLMMPLMLCIMVSKSVADRFTRSAFDIALELNVQIRMLRESAWNCEDINIPIFDLCSREVVVLHCKELASHIMKVLASTRHHSFPLVEGTRAHVVGVAPRKLLMDAVATASEHDVIDLMQFSDLTPDVKHWTTATSRVMTHFRVMGLTSLCIVDKDRALMGIVTRTDISKLSTPKGRRKLFAHLQARAALEAARPPALTFMDEDAASASMTPSISLSPSISPISSRSPSPARRRSLGGPLSPGLAGEASAYRTRSMSLPHVFGGEPTPAGSPTRPSYRRRSASVDNSSNSGSQEFSPERPWQSQGGSPGLVRKRSRPLDDLGHSGPETWRRTLCSLEEEEPHMQHSLSNRSSNRSRSNPNSVALPAWVAQPSSPLPTLLVPPNGGSAKGARSPKRQPKDGVDSPCAAAAMNPGVVCDEPAEESASLAKHLESATELNVVSPSAADVTLLPSPSCE